MKDVKRTQNAFIRLDKSSPAIKFLAKLNSCLEIERVCVTPGVRAFPERTQRFHVVCISRVFALDCLLSCPGPVSSAELVLADPLKVEFRSELGDVDGQRKQPPLPNKGDLELRGDEWQEDPDRVAGSQNVDEEEIVLFACSVGMRSHQDGNSKFLALAELLDRILDLPSVPVI